MRRHPAFLILTFLAVSPAVLAQAYPNAPIRVLTTSIGGVADLSSRIIGQTLGENLGQQVITENRGGATLAIEAAAKARPDGYTLLFYGSPLWLTHLMRKNVAYDYEKDFTPITLATSAPMFLYVHSSVPVNSLPALIAHAKANPGKLNYGSSGAGAQTHLAAELLKARAGIDVVRVLYKGGSQAAKGLLTGEVQMMFGSAAVGLPYVKQGQLKVMGVASAQPSVLAPDVPTLASAGLPSFEVSLINGYFAPAKTPAPIVTRLTQEIDRAIKNPVTRERLLKAGIESRGGPPEQLVAAMKAELAVLGKVITQAGITDE